MRAWYFDSVHTVVSQTLGPMPAQTARFLTGPLDAEAMRRWVGQAEKFRFIYDWRSVESYEPEARTALIDWARSQRSHIEGIWIQLSPEASGFIRIAAMTGVALLRAQRMPVQIVDDLGPLLAPLLQR